MGQASSLSITDDRQSRVPCWTAHQQFRLWRCPTEMWDFALLSMTIFCLP